MTRRGKHRGFTLLELAVVLSVAIILMTMTAAGFRSLIQQQRLTTTANEFFLAIQLARSEAIQRGARVDLVPAGDGRNWANGWVVFVDRNGNLRPDAGEHTVVSHGPVSGGLQVTSNFTDSSRPYLSYNASGRSRTNANSQAPQFGTLSFTLEEQARKIKVNFLGRPRVCNPARDPSTC